MGAADLIVMAMSFSLLAGWRLYAAVLVAGPAMRFDILPLPDQLAGLSVLGNPWVMGIAALGAIAECPADKVAWVDSAWDAIHSLVRPAGGALLALAIVDPGEPVWQVATLLLGAAGAWGQGLGARGGQPQPRAGLERRRLLGRGCGNDRRAAARARQSVDRAGAGRAAAARRCRPRHRHAALRSRSRLDLHARATG